MVAITPPPAGQRVEIRVEAGQTILFQGIGLSTAQIQQVAGGLLITLSNGGVIFLAGFVEAAQSANPPVIELPGNITISAADLLAAADGDTLDIEPAAGPEDGEGDGSGSRFASGEPPSIGEGLGRSSLLALILTEPVSGPAWGGNNTHHIEK